MLNPKRNKELEMRGKQTIKTSERATWKSKENLWQKEKLRIRRKNQWVKNVIALSAVRLACSKIAVNLGTRKGQEPNWERNLVS